MERKAICAVLLLIGAFIMSACGGDYSPAAMSRPMMAPTSTAAMAAPDILPPEKRGATASAPGSADTAPSTLMPTAASASDGYAAMAPTTLPMAGSSAAPAMGGSAPAAGGAPAADNGVALAISTPTTAAALGSTTTNMQGEQSYVQPLSAGKVDDNAEFNAYLEYLRSNPRGDVHPIPVEQRVFLKVVDSDKHPVAGARVQLYTSEQTRVFDGTTVSDGSVLFFPLEEGLTQQTTLHGTITRGQSNIEIKALSTGPQANGVPTFAFGQGAVSNTGPVNLDLVFLLDATGSMGDEISRISGTVNSIARRIEQLPGSSKPRFGLVAYRDRGDAYVTRSWDFTDNVQTFADNLSNVAAEGGGDNPESVNAGLHEAIHLQGWSPNSNGRHLRMIVLVGDAAPHLDYANDFEYTTLLKEAASSGIKIFPIGASGLDDQGEYIFRQFAEVTQGQFVFLTYANGVSGAPGVSTGNHVSNFTVNDLDSLVVGLVAGEVANQTGQEPSSTNPEPATVPLSTGYIGPTPTAKGFSILPLIATLTRLTMPVLTLIAALVWGLLIYLDWRRRTGKQAATGDALSSIDFSLQASNYVSDLTEAARVYGHNPAQPNTIAMYTAPAQGTSMSVYAYEASYPVQPGSGQPTIALPPLPRQPTTEM